MAVTARNFEIIRLTGICEKLAARVEKLEDEVAQLKVRLTDLEEGDPWGTKVEEEETTKPALGRPPLKDRDQMESDYAQILSFLNPRWTTIKRMLSRVRLAKGLRKALSKRFFSRKEIPHRGLDILFNNADVLVKFISDRRRYKGDAIEIAAAMAGVPEMEPRSSYDYFLAKKNRDKFDAQQFGAIDTRVARISAGKRRKLHKSEQGTTGTECAR
jgi:hypothetical protein